MAVNPYLSNKLYNEFEQKTHSQILRRFFYDKGTIIYYVTRTILEENLIFGEANNSIFDKAIEIEAIIPNFGDVDGGHQMFGFGMLFTASTTVQIHRERFNEEIIRHGLDPEEYFEPKAGDLIYIGQGDKTFLNCLYEITKSGEPINFQFGKRFVFELNLEPFKYNYETFNTDNVNIDKMMTEYNNDQVLSTSLNDVAKFHAQDIVNIDIDDPLKETIE